MSDYETVRAAASELSVEERLRLIDDLAASVPDDQPPQLSEEWLSEINRRSSEIENGSVTTENWSDIRARLFARHDVNGAD